MAKMIGTGGTLYRRIGIGTYLPITSVRDLNRISSIWLDGYFAGKWGHDRNWGLSDEWHRGYLAGRLKRHKGIGTVDF